MLRSIREAKGLSRKEVSELSGINFRSLQDYEQGHKKLTSANGDILLRLSTVLGCSIAELLLADSAIGASLHSSNKIDTATIRSQQFYCEKHKVAGRWICNEQQVATMFYFRGKQYLLPFDAVFTPVMLPCLMESAALQIEEEIDGILFRESGFEEW